MMKHPGILLGNAIFFLVFRKRDGHCFEATVNCNCTLLFTVQYILSFEHVSRKEWCTTVLPGRFFIVTTVQHFCDLALLGSYATFSSTLFREHLMSRRIFMGKSLPLGTEQLETLVYPHKLRTRTVALACDGRGSYHQSLGLLKHSWAFVALIHSRESLNVHSSGGFCSDFWNVRLIHPKIRGRWTK